MSFHYSPGVSANKNKRKTSIRIGDQVRLFERSKYSQDPTTQPPKLKKTKTASVPVVTKEKASTEEVDKPSIPDGTSGESEEKEGCESIETPAPKDPDPRNIEENEENPKCEDHDEVEPPAETPSLPGKSDADEPKVGEESTSPGTEQQPGDTEPKTESESGGVEV